MAQVIRTDTSGKSPSYQVILDDIPDERAETWAERLMQDISIIKELRCVRYRAEHGGN